MSLVSPHMDQGYEANIFCLCVNIFGFSERNSVLFLPCDASAERGDATVSRLSVCPSVRP